MAFQKIANFRVVPGKVIIKSESGNEYAITKTSCSCKGFGFHKTCSHFKEATQEGLLNLIVEIPTEAHFFKSPVVVKARKEALRQYLKKHDVPFTDQLIDKIEPRITIKMKPEELLAMVA